MSVQVGSMVTWVEYPPNEGKRLTRTICTYEAFTRHVTKDNRAAYNTYMPETAPMSQEMMGREVGEEFQIGTGVGTKRVVIKRIEHER